MAKAPPKEKEAPCCEVATKLGYKWGCNPPMPTKRVFTAPVVAGEKLFVVGGCDSRGTPLSTFEVYDPAKNKWFRLINMPTKKAGTCAVAIGNKVLTFGGVSLTQKPLDEVEIYDPQTKQWKAGDSLKEPLLGLASVVRDDRVIVVGGMSTDGEPRNTIMSYDAANDRWKMMPSMPTPRYACTAFLVNDKLYVIGGRQGKTPVQAVEVFDFSTEKWKELANLPGRRVFPAYTHSDTHLFSFGGLHEDPKEGFSDACEFYNIEKDEWTVGQPMKQKRGDFVAGCLGSKPIVAGGLGTDGMAMSNNELFDVEKNEWMVLPAMPTAHCSCACIMYKGDFHVIGGLGRSGPSNTIESLKAPSK